MSMNQPVGATTYAHYLEWDLEERYEVIEGTPYLLSAPSPTHQLILGNLYAHLRNFFSKKPCKVFMAPFDVRLFAEGKLDNDIYNVVQPDLTIYCNPNKYDERGGIGVPDLVVEILSPSTAKRDRVLKMNLYERAGIKEYWIIDAANRTVEVYTLVGGRYVRDNTFGDNDIVTSFSFQQFSVSIEAIFE
jgi:Uma2 family endonuclease